MEQNLHLYEFLWTIIGAIVIVAFGAGAALYRQKTNSDRITENKEIIDKKIIDLKLELNMFRRSLFHEDGTLIYVPERDLAKEFECFRNKMSKLEVKMALCITEKEHLLVCENQGLKTRDHFEAAFQVFQDKLLKKTAELLQPIVENQKKNNSKLEDLDRRTVHLK